MNISVCKPRLDLRFNNTCNYASTLEEKKKKKKKGLKKL